MLEHKKFAMVVKSGLAQLEAIASAEWMRMMMGKVQNYLNENFCYWISIDTVGKLPGNDV